MRKMAFSLIPAEIRSYTPLFKGRRFCVLQIDPVRPYGIHTDGQYDQALVYESQIDAVIANGY